MAKITYNPWRLFDGIVLLIVGWVIIILGVMASYFKVMSALISESFSGEKENHPVPPQP